MFHILFLRTIGEPYADGAGSELGSSASRKSYITGLYGRDCEGQQIRARFAIEFSHVSQFDRPTHDHALMLLLNLLDEDTNAASDTGGATEVRAKLETELSRLTQTLGNPEKVEIETADQLLQLQSELIQADLHLAAVEQQSQRELELLNAEKRTVEQTTSEVIARCGPAAVPLLVELLSDERVEIRRWAAKALGAIGPDARDANLLLRELLSDPDPTVRAEVEQALAKMD
jgi:hypothetical protein